MNNMATDLDKAASQSKTNLEGMLTTGDAGLSLASNDKASHEVIKKGNEAEHPLSTASLPSADASTQTPAELERATGTLDNVLTLDTGSDDVFGIPQESSPTLLTNIGQGSSVQEKPEGEERKYEVIKLGYKGFGLVATTAIEAREVITAESPLFTCKGFASSAEQMESIVLEAIKDLTPEQREFVHHKLTNAKSDKTHHLAGCFSTNALPCGPKILVGAIFRDIARANHSCVPNAVYHWEDQEDKGAGNRNIVAMLKSKETDMVDKEKTTGTAALSDVGEKEHVEDHGIAAKSNEVAGCGVLTAISSIAAGEEITINYIDLIPHAERREELKHGFNFDCECRLCGLDEKRREAEDKRIEEIDDLEYDLFTDLENPSVQPAKCLENFRRLLRLYGESEAERGLDIDLVHAKLVRMCMKHWQFEEAVRIVVETSGLDEEGVREACRECQKEIQ